MRLRAQQNIIIVSIPMSTPPTLLTLASLRSLSVDIGKSHAIEAFLFDSRNSFSSTVNEINRDLRRKSSSKVERVATSSGYSDIMKTLGSVGCFSPSLDAPVAQSVQRSGLAVALFGCSSHQAPLRYELGIR
ncbi:hypothetical protein TL16_g11174 [Triparma laevis f. inornata]|uniref:Uncharacterized protein n=1 Tax=Triparma laevis f. inornata TaxID=1714386 RepID=A0A9W7BK55_9STRA|nr:hypothetical protein TL16_g11174 [Triparma laevis f. inornata]